MVSLSDIRVNGKFLINDILMFDSARYLVMGQIQFSIIKKRLDVQSTRYPPPPTSDNISFLPYPHPSLPLKVDVSTK